MGSSSSSLNDESKAFAELIVQATNRINNDTTSNKADNDDDDDSIPEKLFSSAKAHGTSTLKLLVPISLNGRETCLLAEVFILALHNASYTKTWNYLVHDVLYIRLADNQRKEGTYYNKDEPSLVDPFVTEIPSSFVETKDKDDKFHPGRRKCSLVELVMLRTAEHCKCSATTLDEKEKLRITQLLHKTLVDDLLITFKIGLFGDLEHLQSLNMYCATEISRYNRDGAPAPRGSFLQYCIKIFPEDVELFKKVLAQVNNFDHSLKDDDGYTILHQLCLSDDRDKCAMLQEFLSLGQASNHKWMINSTYDGLQASSPELFDKYYNILTSTFGDTPLNIAIRRSATGIVGDLVSAGVGGSFDTVKNRKNSTVPNPMTLAMSVGYVQEGSLKSSADVDAYTAKRDEIEKRQSEIVQILVSLPHGPEAAFWNHHMAGDNDERQVFAGHSAVGVAVQKGHLQRLRVILSNVKLTKEGREALVQTADGNRAVLNVLDEFNSSSEE